jgi:hypothetical protein
MAHYYTHTCQNIYKVLVCLMHFPIFGLQILKLFFGNVLVDLVATLFNFQMNDTHAFHDVNYDFAILVCSFQH